jgi:hypothetical protein
VPLENTPVFTIPIDNQLVWCGKYIQISGGVYTKSEKLELARRTKKKPAVGLRERPVPVSLTRSCGSQPRERERNDLSRAAAFDTRLIVLAAGGTSISNTLLTTVHAVQLALSTSSAASGVADPARIKTTSADAAGIRAVATIAATVEYRETVRVWVVYAAVVVIRMTITFANRVIGVTGGTSGECCY